MAAIRELMATDIVTARSDDMVSDIVLRMSRNGIGAVLVTAADGKLQGVFTERDLLDRVVAQSRDPRVTPAQHVATPNPVVIELDWPIRKVLEVFRDRRFRHLPVVSQGKPVGILSTRDFLSALVEGFERYVDELKYKRELAEGIDPYDHIGGSYGR